MIAKHSAQPALGIEQIAERKIKWSGISAVRRLGTANLDIIVAVIMSKNSGMRQEIQGHKRKERNSRHRYELSRQPNANCSLQFNWAKEDGNYNTRIA